MGDRLLASELSRLGRSLGQVIQIVDTLVHRNIRFIAIKEGIEFDGQQDLQTKVMIALFGLFAEVERDLISERTKEGLAAATGLMLYFNSNLVATLLSEHKDVRSVSILKDGRAVFNIAGNKYRIVVWINYPYRVVIRFIGTHRRYDAIDAPLSLKRVISQWPGQVCVENNAVGQYVLELQNARPTRCRLLCLGRSLSGADPALPGASQGLPPRL